MQPLIRRILLTACCAWVATGCSGADSGALYSPVYYGADWYYGDDWYLSRDDDISLPERPDRPLKPEHPIALPPKEGPPVASQLPSGIEKPSTLPRQTPSFSTGRPSIPSMPRAAPRGGGGGRRR
jgi:hypothetical protein